VSAFGAFSFPPLPDRCYSSAYPPAFRTPPLFPIVPVPAFMMNAVVLGTPLPPPPFFTLFPALLIPRTEPFGKDDNFLAIRHQCALAPFLSLEALLFLLLVVAREKGVRENLAVTPCGFGCTVTFSPFSFPFSLPPLLLIPSRANRDPLVLKVCSPSAAEVSFPMPGCVRVVFRGG